MAAPTISPARNTRSRALALRNGVVMTGGVLKPLWRIDDPEVKIIDVFIAAAQEAGPGRATDLNGTVGRGYVLREPGGRPRAGWQPAPRDGLRARDTRPPRAPSRGHARLARRMTRPHRRRLGVRQRAAPIAAAPHPGLSSPSRRRRFMDSALARGGTSRSVSPSTVSAPRDRPRTGASTRQGGGTRALSALRNRSARCGRPPHRSGRARALVQQVEILPAAHRAQLLAARQRCPSCGIFTSICTGRPRAPRTG